ncbi:hypothetical protein [Clostridium tyrobutyricum]|uniref:hypothetical protein n=1 Tax=Clostridium tyrobutyricum TaxID=1519 RepID=UPI0020126911|nr:hypothetical protein [Clostridium tyrobutyricum]
MIDLKQKYKEELQLYKPDGTVYGEGSAYKQTKYILEKLVKLIQKIFMISNLFVQLLAHSYDQPSYTINRDREGCNSWV